MKLNKLFFLFKIWYYWKKIINLVEWIQNRAKIIKEDNLKRIGEDKFYRFNVKKIIFIKNKTFKFWEKNNSSFYKKQLILSLISDLDKNLNLKRKRNSLNKPRFLKNIIYLYKIIFIIENSIRKKLGIFSFILKVYYLFLKILYIIF